MIISWINDAVKRLSILIHELDEEHAKRIRVQLEAQYANSAIEGALGERLKHSFGVLDTEGWKKIGDLTSDRRIVLFFDESETRKMFELENGKQLVRILEECPGFEFYVTNQGCEFILCHNHHDYLIASGTAIRWLNEFVA